MGVLGTEPWVSARAESDLNAKPSLQPQASFLNSCILGPGGVHQVLSALTGKEPQLFIQAASLRRGLE